MKTCAALVVLLLFCSGIASAQWKKGDERAKLEIALARGQSMRVRESLELSHADQ
jgi:hypothetical protein